MIKRFLKRHKVRLIGYATVALLLAMFVTFLPPVQVSITSEGMLSISTNVALATTAIDSNSTTEILYDTEGDGFDGYWKYASAHVHNGKLKVGIAFYPNEGALSYAVQHVKLPKLEENPYLGLVNAQGQPVDWDAYNAWIEALLADENTSYWVTNPTFTHFITVDPDITIAELEAEIERIFTPNVLASADAYLSVVGTEEEERVGFSSYRELMQDTERLGSGQILSKGYDDAALIAATNEKFAGLSGELDGKGKIIPIEPGTITIGAEAKDRASHLFVYDGMFTYTYVNAGSAADGDGEITSCEIWLASKNGTIDVWVGTFSIDGTTLTCRDSESIGDKAAGSKQTASGLTINVVTDDLWGMSHKTTVQFQVERDATGYDGVWWKDEECIDPSDSATFGSYAGDAISLYGEGEEAPSCEEDITNSPSSWSVNAGTPVASSSNYSTGLDFFTVTNNSGGAIDITISGTDMTGGDTWTLSDTATPASMVYGLKAGLDGGDYTIIVKKNATFNDLVTSLADSGTQDWGLKLYTPTEFTDGTGKSGTVTLTAVCN